MDGLRLLGEDFVTYGRIPRPHDGLKSRGELSTLGFPLGIESFGLQSWGFLSVGAYTAVSTIRRSEDPLPH